MGADVMRECIIGELGGLSVVKVTRQQLSEMIAKKITFEPARGVKPFFVRQHRNFMNIWQHKCRREDYEKYL